MKFSNSHKALAITLLIVGTLVLSVININLYKYNTQVVETYIDITPTKILEEIEEQEDILSSKRTNQGYNKTKKYKHFAQAYKTIAPPEDFVDPRLTKRQLEDFKMNTVSKNNSKNTIKNEDLTSFESVNSILKKRSSASSQSQSENAVNKNSSIIFSLKGRTGTYLPIPVYLCETTGKIVVNITVDGNGKVTKSSINTASTSSNSCLTEYALEYAEDAHFDISSQDSQIGTITFYFEGKR